MHFSEKNKIIILVGISVVLLFLVVGIGVTYSLWNKSFQQSEENKIVSDCFRVTFEEVQDTSIHLEDAFPMPDREGSRLKPYQFKVKNNCDAFVKYDVLLDVPVRVTLKAEYLKVKLDQSVPNLLSSYLIDEKNQDERKQSYILDQWYLKYQEEKEYSFWVWMDENVTQDMEGVQNGEWSGKIRISAAYSSEGLQDPGTLRMIASSDQEGMWGYKENITKIVIQNKLELVENAEASYDESILQDESVKSYVVPNGDGTYTGYLQSNKELVLNSGDNLFRGFSKVTEIEGLEYVNTSNVTNMGSMFRGMRSLTNLDVSNFDTSKVTNMAYMFDSMRSLTSLDVSNFDTSNVTNMPYMFQSMDNLVSLDVSHFNTSKVVNMGAMFQNIYNLPNLDLSSFDTSNVTNMGSMFAQMSHLKNIDVSHFNTSKVTSMAAMFSGVKNLTSLDISNFDTSNVLYMHQMFSGMSSLTSLDVSHFDTSSVTSMFYMFSGMKNLTSLDVSNFDTSNVTNMSFMFKEMTTLTSIDVSNFDTSKVTNMSFMFQEMTNLESLDVSNFNTSNVTDMSGMFWILSNVTSLNVSNFDTSKVTNMNSMFARMTNLIDLDVSNFNTSNVTGMGGMFAHMTSLESLNVSHFDTSKVTNMYIMFQNVWRISNLDLRSFTILDGIKVESMFNGMSSTLNVQVKDQDTQTKVLNSPDRPAEWSTSNVVIVA